MSALERANAIEFDLIRFFVGHDDIDDISAAGIGARHFATLAKVLASKPGSNNTFAIFDGTGALS